jgi:hypothetical protein
MIYVKSFLTGLAAVFAAVFLVGIVLTASEWKSTVSVDVRLIAGPVLVASFLAFAAGFSWQYLRLSHKGSFARRDS